MTAKDYIDTKRYWISPDRTIRRMSDEDGEQEMIVKKRDACSGTEWKLACEALTAPSIQLGIREFSASDVSRD
jgi:hypothetical protein